METLAKIGRTFYGVAIMIIGSIQIFYADFRTVILPPWPGWRNTSPEIAAYITGAALILAGATIIFSKRGKDVALILGGILLTLVVFWHLPYILFIQPHQIENLGLWAEASKALALAGGAFVVAGTFKNENAINKNFVIEVLEKLIPCGRIFFCIVMIEFGVDHILYIENIATLVPAWISGSVFWTYFAALALIGSGLAIILNVKVRLVAMLLGVMIFMWFILLHIPRAIEFPELNKGNEIASSADALAFSGIAFIIACVNNKKE
jgi:uncharacterized membrane protein YphA (DoxX/SURF4 family)